MSDKALIESKLREIREFIKSTEMSYPNPRTFLALIGAAVAINAGDTVEGLSGEFSEFKLHLDDAFEPLGLRIDKVRLPRGRPPGRTGYVRKTPA
jgi:hypothetical protein